MAEEPMPTPESGGERIAGLVDYFHRHRDAFTGEALASAARAAGYSPAEIEAAWAQVGWGSAEAAMSRPEDFGVSAVVAIIFVAGTYIGAIGLGSNPRTSGLALPALLLALLGGALAWAALREWNPAVARGLGCGIVIAIALPAVLVLVVLGFCIAAGYTPPF
jgi:hypothetical protein